MTTPIQATNSTEKPSGLKRTFYSLMPCPAATYEIGKALAEGKTVKEAWTETKETFKEVHEGNTEQTKENIHYMAEQSREMGDKYLIGFVARTIVEKLDEAINK